QRVLDGDADVARQGELEPDAHRVLFERADHGLRAAAGRGHVEGELRHPVERNLRERLDVAARAENAVGAANDDDAHVVVLAEGLDQCRDLAAPAIGHDVERRAVEPQPGDLARRVHFVAQPVEVLEDRGAHFRVVLAHRCSFAVLLTVAPAAAYGCTASYSPARSLRRRILPEAERGRDRTKTYSRGRLKRARPLRRHASSSCAGSTGALAHSTNATTRAPRRSSGIPTTATLAISPERMSASSTSSA